MKAEEILLKCDHTLLNQTCSWTDIQALCDDAIKYSTASVCIPPSYVKKAKDYVLDRMAICTVIGFPNGYATTQTKVFETSDAVKNGADEIDMVVNLGWVKEHAYSLVLDEIKQVRAQCEGKILKVIIETCLLNQEEKVAMCGVVTESGADFIKTSTGFSTGGATADDIKLLRENVGASVKVKAAGGISSLADAEHLIRLGADRLGTSRVVKLIKLEQAGGY